MVGGRKEAVMEDVNPQTPDEPEDPETADEPTPEPEPDRQDANVTPDPVGSSAGTQ